MSIWSAWNAGAGHVSIFRFGLFVIDYDGIGGGADSDHTAHADHVLTTAGKPPVSTA